MSFLRGRNFPALRENRGDLQTIQINDIRTTFFHKLEWMGLTKAMLYIFCSWDEMVKYDLPAMLKFVTTKTSQSSLYYVGHSQGTAIGFAGFASNEEMATMVKTFFALAPVTTVANIKGPLKLLAKNSIEISVVNALHK